MKVKGSDYEVTLAQAAKTISSMSTNFQANLRNPVLVKDGALSIGANQFTAGGNPNAFGEARSAGYAVCLSRRRPGDAVHAHRQ